jgi:hypothetical protein
VTGDKEWSCPDLAARILRRLVARYGRDIVIIHGNEPGVDASFDAAAKEMGLKVEARVINRKITGFPTVGQRNRELLIGGADICLAVHNRVHLAPGRSTAFCKPCRMESPRMGSRTCTRSPGGSSEGIQGFIDSLRDSDPAEIGVRVDAVCLLRSVVFW